MDGKHFIFTAAFILWIAAGSCSDCSAQSIPSIDLINNAAQHDGKELMFQGEVVGDIMRRGSFVWVNVSDGVNALGIWADSALVKDIAFAGSYRIQGDTVEITGIFHRACPEHGGDLDIHASKISIMRWGAKIPERPDYSKIKTAVLLLGILILAWILSLLRRK